MRTTDATPGPTLSGRPPAPERRLDPAGLLGGFTVPGGTEMGTPPELRRTGGHVGDDGRADVRLLVARGARGGRGDRAGGDGGAPEVAHRCFAEIVDELAAGDVLVVNASAVRPAALDATAPDGTPFRLHLSTEQPGGFWVVEPRVPAGPGTERFTGTPPSTLALPGGGRADLLTPFPSGSAARRLWLARLDLPVTVTAPGRLAGATAASTSGAGAPSTSGGGLDGAAGPAGTRLDRYLEAFGQPVRYGHTAGAWPIEAYQTVFSRVPGSVEMPSASRPFTDRIVARLVAAGVTVVPIVLHTGVSSQEAGEAPYAERYEVPVATADIVNAARAAGGRVIAAGTTVVRALESTADPAGRSHPGRGWTELVVTPQRGVRVVDGLITGWHEPESSHLALLEAVAGRQTLEASYREAVRSRYLWHEFGDSHLILP
jgi:S-adenosylmethionine:tRNA ribosyltransferase-isomerase